MLRIFFFLFVGLTRMSCEGPYMEEKDFLPDLKSSKTEDYEKETPVVPVGLATIHSELIHLKIVRKK